MLKISIKFLLTIFLLVLCGVSYLQYNIDAWFNTPVHPEIFNQYQSQTDNNDLTWDVVTLAPMKAYSIPECQISVTVHPKDSLHSIAYALENQGIISSAWKFRLAVLLKYGRKPNLVLQQGDYAFSCMMSPSLMLHKMFMGDIASRTINIISGMNQYQIAYYLHTVYPNQSTQIFLDTMTQELSIIQNQLPEFATVDSPEGFLYPDTYKMPLNATPKEVIDRIYKEFVRKYANLDKIDNHNYKSLAPYQYLVLASMIENEAKRDYEIPVLASVFRNRLQIHMPLQSDPTAVYTKYSANTNSLHKIPVTASDVHTSTSYNTYSIKSLPPTPISNFRFIVLQGAYNPQATKLLYFVAKRDGSGEHIFSKDYATHKTMIHQNH
jgi:UPF0755 protein